MRDTFKEADVEEPNWQTVSSNLKLVMYGQVSVTEFYQAWRNPSWEKLSHALEKSHEYHQVAELAKKKAGVCVCMCGTCNIYLRICSPIAWVDYRRQQGNTYMPYCRKDIAQWFVSNGSCINTTFF